jgi:hypothetical protein
MHHGIDNYPSGDPDKNTLLRVYRGDFIKNLMIKYPLADSKIRQIFRANSFFSRKNDNIFN